LDPWRDKERLRTWGHVATASPYLGFPDWALRPILTNFDQFTPKRPQGHMMHVTPAHQLPATSGSGFGGPGSLTVEGLQEHNGTAIKTIAFLIAFAQFTVLLNQRDTCSPRGTLTAPNLQSMTQNCMNHLSQLSISHHASSRDGGAGVCCGVPQGCQEWTAA